MNREAFISLLEARLRGMFMQIRHGSRPPEAERRYCEGLAHAAQALHALSADEIHTVIERVNMEVFGVSVAERMLRYPIDALSDTENSEIPTYIRKGIRIDC